MNENKLPRDCANRSETATEANNPKKSKHEYAQADNSIGNCSACGSDDLKDGKHIVRADDTVQTSVVEDASGDYRYKYGLRPSIEEHRLIADESAPIADRLEAVGRTSWFPLSPGCGDDDKREVVMESVAVLKRSVSGEPRDERPCKDDACICDVTSASWRGPQDCQVHR